ncbi:MAG TPA: RNA methyltransferase [Ruminococcaceae bacterium]|nr:RNA methyltransferase [Oscillospiraceae bacterium]
MREYVRLTGAGNERIKDAVKLAADSSFRKKTGRFVLEGARLCLDAVSNGIIPEAVFFTKEAMEKYPLSTLLEKTAPDKCFELPPGLYRKLSDTNSPQGISCVCPAFERTDPINVLKKGGRYLALENIQDPGNFGAMARTGEALGLDGLFAGANCCDRYNPKALRAGMGALLRENVFTDMDIVAFIKQAAAMGIASYAAVAHPPAEPVTGIDFSGGGIMVLGNEGSGLTEAMTAVCSKRVTVPMKGRAESLNAAAAASILLWEMMRGL